MHARTLHPPPSRHTRPGLAHTSVCEVRLTPYTAMGVCASIHPPGAYSAAVTARSVYWPPATPPLPPFSLCGGAPQGMEHYPSSRTVEEGLQAVGGVGVLAAGGVEGRGAGGGSEGEQAEEGQARHGFA